MQWTIHTQGPDEPVYVIEADGAARFVARLDEEGKTRAEVLANGFRLAASLDLLTALEELIDHGDLALYAGYVGRQRIAKVRAAIAKAKGIPCDHNEIVANDEPGYAWKCTKCGHVYGKKA